MLGFRRVPRRLVFVLVVLFTLAAFTLGVVVIRKSQIREELMAYGPEGIRAFEEGNHRKALKLLGQYLRENDDDVEAIYAYARARLQVADDRGKHDKQAIAAFRHLLQIAPEHEAGRRELMGVYWRLSYVTEALDMAEELLQRNAGDVEALSTKATALARLGRYDEALPAALMAAQVDVTDLEGHLLVLEIKRRSNATSEELVNYVKGLQAQYPKEMRFSLLLAVAYYVVGERESALHWFKNVATADVVEYEFNRILVDHLDLLGEHTIATDRLKQVANESSDIRLKRAYAARLWQSGKPDQLIQYLSAVAREGVGADTQLLVFKALGLNAQGDRSAAQKVVAELAARPGDTIAVAWVPLFESVIFAGTPDAPRVVRLTEGALQRVPNEPHILLLKGMAHLALDETQRALDCWRESAAAAPAWPLPRVRLARSFAAQGRGIEGMQAAREAIMRSPGSVEAAIALALAADSLGQDRINPGPLLRLVEQIQQYVPSEPQTLPMYVRLLARFEQADKAREKLTAVLVPDDLPPTRTLLRLAEVSKSEGLALESVILARLKDVHGTSPEYAYYLARAGDGSVRDQVAALGLFDREWAQSSDGRSASNWRLARAQLLSDLGHTDAGPAWVALADDFPENTTIQRRALRIPAVQSEREFISRVIGRMRKLGGEDAVEWRLAQARWLLSRDEEEATAKEAASLLNEAVESSFSQADARRLLAVCMIRLDNLPGAVEQLQTAHQLSPQRTDIALQLAAALQSVGDFAASREQIDRLLDRRILSRRERRQVAQLLAAQGATDLAIHALQIDAADETTGPDSVALEREPDILLARLYWLRNQPEKARPIFEAMLAKEGDPNPLVLQLTANFFASIGDKDSASKTLDRLQAINLAAGIRELLYADHHSRFGDPDKATELFRAATRAAPTNANAWRQYAAHLVRQQRLSDASTVISAARSNLPDDVGIAFLARQVPLIERSVQLDRLHPMVSDLITDMKHQQVAARTLTIVVESEERQKTLGSLMRELGGLADRYPSYVTLQNLVASTSLALGQNDAAARVATRAMEAFPTAVRPAALATAALSGAERWQETITVAREWQSRSGQRASRAAVLETQAHLASGDAQSALKAIHPFVEAALKKPAEQGSKEVLAAYANAQLADGMTEELLEWLAPLGKNDIQWRFVWRRLAVREAKDTRVASLLLNQLAAFVPSDNPNESLAMAEAWAHLAARPDGSEYRDRALREVEALVKRPDRTAEVLLIHGSLAEAKGDLAMAEASYRQSIQLSAKNAPALNNLAMVLMAANKNSQEALRLAQGAVEIDSSQPAYLDTLASAQVANGKAAEAVETMRRAVKIQPQSVLWRLNLISALIEDSRKAEAQALFNALQSELDRGTIVTLSRSERVRLGQIRDRIEKK